MGPTIAQEPRASWRAHLSGATPEPSIANSWGQQRGSTSRVEAIRPPHNITAGATAWEPSSPVFHVKHQHDDHPRSSGAWGSRGGCGECHPVGCAPPTTNPRTVTYARFIVSSLAIMVRSVATLPSASPLTLMHGAASCTRHETLTDNSVPAPSGRPANVAGAIPTGSLHGAAAD